MIVYINSFHHLLYNQLKIGRECIAQVFTIRNIVKKYLTVDQKILCSSVEMDCAQKNFEAFVAI